MMMRTVLLLAISLLVIAAWIRSEFAIDLLRWSVPSHASVSQTDSEWRVWSGGGVLLIGHTQTWALPVIPEGEDPLEAESCWQALPPHGDAFIDPDNRVDVISLGIGDLSLPPTLRIWVPCGSFNYWDADPSGWATYPQGRWAIVLPLEPFAVGGFTFVALILFNALTRRRRARLRMQAAPSHRLANQPSGSTLSALFKIWLTCCIAVCVLWVVLLVMDASCGFAYAEWRGSLDSSWLAIQLPSAKTPFPSPFESFSMPAYIIALAAAVSPAIVAARRLRGWLKRASRGGFCPKCGYDLRCTPTRCPECGTRVTQLEPGEPARSASLFS